MGAAAIKTPAVQRRTAMEEQTATVRKIVPVGADIRILYLQPERELAYKAGQYIYLTFDEAVPARPAAKNGGR